MQELLTLLIPLFFIGLIIFGLFSKSPKMNKPLVEMPKIPETILGKTVYYIAIGLFIVLMLITIFYLAGGSIGDSEDEDNLYAIAKVLSVVLMSGTIGYILSRKNRI